MRFLLVAVVQFVVGIGLQVVAVLPSDGSLDWITWLVFSPLYTWSFGLIGKSQTKGETTDAGCSEGPPRMHPALEDRLWESAGVRSVSELPQFPFRSYKAFVAAVRNGDAAIGIEYGAARELAHVTKSPAASYALLALSFVPLLFVPASVILAVVTGRWTTLLGIPTALIAMFLSSPYNPLRHIALLGSLASAAYCLIAGTVFTAGTWSLFGFGLSFFAMRFLNRIAWNWASEAVLVSEALTAHLWKTANLHIKGKEFGMRSLAVHIRIDGRERWLQKISRFAMRGIDKWENHVPTDLLTR